MYKKKMFIYLALIFFIFIKNTLSYENSIIAKIEKEIITSIDVENESKYLLILNDNLKKFNEKEIFEISKRSIVREKIKNIEIKKKFRNPNVPKDFIEQILKNIYQNIGIENLETFKKYLNENDIEYEYVKDKIEIETLWNELIIAKFSSEIKIDQDKIRQELATNNKKYSKSFFVLEIFFDTSDSKKIQEIYSDIEKTIRDDGFNKAVLTYSSSSTASTRGELGWIQEEALNENLKNIFYEMNEGEYTKPITVPGGFLVLKIDKIKKEKINIDIEKKINEIIKIKKDSQLNQFSKMYFNKIKKDVKINEF
ncbi:peptidylprolyl isomerase [Candidatus Pelagibacter sp.]|nr:peptidylprolyl isomerase [Candidatus Pelagibacter sp.]